MDADMINKKKITSITKMRRNRIMQSNLNLDICDGLSFYIDKLFVVGPVFCSRRSSSFHCAHWTNVFRAVAANKLACSCDRLTAYKKSLNIIKFRYATFSFHDMLFKYTKKTILISMCALSVASCSYTTEEAAYNFEDRLESFIGKPMQELIRRCGSPVRYLNESDAPGDESGTYMIYNFKRSNSECEVIMKYQKRTMKIIDWDYSGYCLNTNKFRMDDGCFGL